VFRPQVDLLEDRLPPGDAFLSGILGATTLAAWVSSPAPALAITSGPSPAFHLAQPTDGSSADQSSTSTPFGSVVQDVTIRPAAKDDTPLPAANNSAGRGDPLFVGWSSDPLAAADPVADTAPFKSFARLDPSDSGRNGSSATGLDDAQAAGSTSREASAGGNPALAALDGNAMPGPAPVVPQEGRRDRPGRDSHHDGGSLVLTNPYDNIPLLAPDTASCTCASYPDVIDNALGTLDRGTSPVSTALGTSFDPADVVQDAYGALPNNPSMFSEAPVRYADGAPKVVVLPTPPLPILAG
jgi:hypothetical protein